MKLLALTFLFISFELYALPTQNEVHTKLEKIRGKFKNAALAVGIVGKNGLIFSSVHGHQDLENNVPITDESLFMIGSTTKAFTSTGIGTLVERELMSWDDRVTHIIPEFELMSREVTDKITIRDLLTHMSGLPRHDLTWITRRYMTMEENLAILPYLPLSYGLREKWQYNNLLYMVAGMAMGRVRNSSWTEIVQDNILDPLGMEETYFSTNDILSLSNVAYPYYMSRGNLVRRTIKNIDGIGPAGSIHSNIKDMAKWVQLNINSGSFNGKQVVSEDIMNEIHRGQVKVSRGNWFPEMTNSHYGFAWTSTNYRGTKMIRHGGSINSYLTQIAFFPEKKLGIIILTSGGNLSTGMTLLTLSDMILELEPIDWLKRYQYDSKPNPIPQKDGPIDLSPAIGTFHHIAYGEIVSKELIINNTKYLQLTLNGMVIATFPVWFGNDDKTWTFDHDGTSIRLFLDEMNKVDKISINIEPRTERITFTRE